MSVKVRLRATIDADLDFVLQAEQSVENRPFITLWTREQHRGAVNAKDQLHLIIESPADSSRVGYIILAGLKSSNHSIELTRIVVTDKGKGFGREAFCLIKELAFGELQAHRLWLDVKAHNERAKHVYESEGFLVEGILRECIKSDQGYESLVIMSMLKPEYLE